MRLSGQRIRLHNPGPLEGEKPREAQHLANGIEKADSWATDGHKWLQVPYDCGYAFVRNTEAHRQAMRIEASYLTASEQGVRDPRNYVGSGANR
ncbi:pyridoxal-dependent decarboxylase [Paraburkholderia atlantica]|uniref:pyridoxal-dependent decarboxylase n=1 Tax=Paraburkholderia atlantica TaxID=2654982 RepID=UPI003D1AEE45